MVTRQLNLLLSSFFVFLIVFVPVANGIPPTPVPVNVGGGNWSGAKVQGSFLYLSEWDRMSFSRVSLDGLTFQRTDAQGSGFLITGMDADSGYLYEGVYDFAGPGGFIVRSAFPNGPFQVLYDYTAQQRVFGALAYMLVEVGGIDAVGDRVYFVGKMGLSLTGYQCYVGSLSTRSGLITVLGTYPCSSNAFTVAHTHVFATISTPGFVYFLEPGPRIGVVPTTGGVVSFIGFLGQGGGSWGPSFLSDVHYITVQNGVVYFTAGSALFAANGGAITTLYVAPCVPGQPCRISGLDGYQHAVGGGPPNRYVVFASDTGLYLWHIGDPPGTLPTLLTTDGIYDAYDVSISGLTAYFTSSSGAFSIELP